MSLSRSLSLAGSFAGAVCNLAFALRLLALSRSLGWETESEWEGSSDTRTIDYVRLVWALLFAYFAAAAASCFIGFVGIAKVCYRSVLPFLHLPRPSSLRVLHVSSMKC